MKKLILNLLPYIFSLSIGVFVYILTIVFIEDAGINNLMVNIASGLLSIPLIFISYELVKSACDSKLNGTILEHINQSAKHCMIGVIKDLHQLLPPKADNLEDYLRQTKHEIKKNLTLENFDISPLLEQKNTLDKLLVGNKHIDLVPHDEVHALLSVSREIGLLALQLKKKNQADDFLSNSVFNLLAAINRWIDSLEDGDTISGSHFFELKDFEEESS